MVHRPAADGGETADMGQRSALLNALAVHDAMPFPEGPENDRFADEWFGRMLMLDADIAISARQVADGDRAAEDFPVDLFNRDLLALGEVLRDVGSELDGDDVERHAHSLAYQAALESVVSAVADLRSTSPDTAHLYSPSNGDSSEPSLPASTAELDRFVDLACDDHAGRTNLAITEGWRAPARRLRDLVSALDALGGHRRRNELVAWRGITARAAVLRAPDVDESSAVRYLEAVQHAAGRARHHEIADELAALLRDQPEPWVEMAASLGRPEAGEPLARVVGTASVWSPDGTRLATGSDDGTMSVWRLEGDRLVTSAAALTGHTAAVDLMAWSPDGTRLASGSDDGTVMVWRVDGNGSASRTANLTDGAQPQLLFLSGPGMAWSPDGTRLATGWNDGTATVWTVDQHGHSTATAALTGHSAKVPSVAWSPDGTRLATGSLDDNVIIWEADQDGHSTAAARLTTHARGVLTVAWSPDGTRLAAGTWDDTVAVWTVDDDGHWTATTTIPGEGAERALAWSPDGQHLATLPNRGLVVWDVERNDHSTAVASLTGHAWCLMSVAWSPDGSRLATGSDDGTVIIWEVGEDGHHTVAGTLDGHEHPVMSVAWSSDGTQLATGSGDGSTIVWLLPASPPAPPTGP